MTLVQVRLARDSFQTPWGFRLQGGKDLNQELTVQKVFIYTPSEGELQRGDVIVAINGRDTSAYSHKQALDAISGSGGQIELLVQRPPAYQVNIQPVAPATETRAPTFPSSSTKAHQIIIPIQRRKSGPESGPESPSRIIPIPVQKPSPSRTTAARLEQPSDMSTTAGFMPKKVTLNKYGGGGMDFGSAYGPAAAHMPQSPQRAPQSPSYRPAGTQMQMPQDYYDSPQNQPPVSYQTQFSDPLYISPQQQEERQGVQEEELGGVNERRRLFMKGIQQAPMIQKTRKPVPKLDRNTASEGYTNFGVDYSKPLPKPQPSKHATTSRQRPPPVNRFDEEQDSAGTPWSNTLRSESKQLKPWEREALEMERYQSSTVDEPYRPHSQPPATDKPKIVQITSKSTSRPSDQQLSTSVRSVPHSSPQTPSQHRTVPSFQNNVSPDMTNDAYFRQGYENNQSKIVHLQYNTPIGLYSKDNIVDTYVGQAQGRSLSPSTLEGKKKPLLQGECEWNDSHAYKMIHSAEQTTFASRQEAPGQPPKGESVTRCKEINETKYPGYDPQRRVTETVTRAGIPDYTFDSSIGLSDF